METGVYCLVMGNTPRTVRVGALGLITFPAGWHVYTGSAQGPGGLKRVQRHVRLARSRELARHWHIDYLLTDEGFTLHTALCAETRRNTECELAHVIRGVPVAGFGCSDCHCSSHLFYFASDPADEIASAMEAIGLVPIIARINTKQGQC